MAKPKPKPKRSSAPAKTTALAVVGETTKIRDADKRHVETLLSLIERRKARISEDFYEIGKALRELKQKKLHFAAGFASFGEMLKARDVMSLTSAKKLIAIVASVPVEKALALGVEKAYALARYTAATPEPDSPALLLDADAEVAGTKVSVATVRDLNLASKKARAKTSPKRAVNPKEAAAAKAARDVSIWLRAHKIRGANVTTKRVEKAYRIFVELPVPAAATLTSVGK
jgi:hypothetical protein